MRLVRRLRGTTMVEVAPPRGQTTDSDEARVLPLSCINDAPYSKLFSANKQQVIFFRYIVYYFVVENDVVAVPIE